MSASLIDIVDGITKAVKREMSPDEIMMLDRLRARTDYDEDADWYVNQMLEVMVDKSEAEKAEPLISRFEARERGLHGPTAAPIPAPSKEEK